MIRKLKPGQSGTKKFLSQYGERLVCVRYRYDAHAGKRIKTVEIIVEESDWLPPTQRYLPDELVWLHTGFVDHSTEQRIRLAGGKWDSKRCFWKIRYYAAVTLGFPLTSSDVRFRHRPTFYWSIEKQFVYSETCFSVDKVRHAA